MHSPVVHFAYPSDEQGGFDNLRREVKLELWSLRRRCIAWPRSVSIARSPMEGDPAGVALSLVVCGSLSVSSARSESQSVEPAPHSIAVLERGSQLQLGGTWKGRLDRSRRHSQTEQRASGTRVASHAYPGYG